MVALQIKERNKLTLEGCKKKFFNLKNKQKRFFICIPWKHITEGKQRKTNFIPEQFGLIMFTELLFIGNFYSVLCNFYCYKSKTFTK